ncbi:MAG: KilA-N domain-containing protein [Bacteroidales bacterium]|nr:KilA-N domain-containing protein [Bacteroidales bacterium]
MKKIEVVGREILIDYKNSEDFISITDIAKFKNPDAPADVVKNWLRSKNAIELLGLWEKLYNPDFKLVEFDRFRNEAGFNHFVLSPKKWIETTNAIGLISKSGRYGGTFAHKDIAFEFASWVSVEFKLYLIKEFQRLKLDENNRLKLEWNFQRMLTKVNYHIHTDAIKENLIPEKLSKNQISYIYTNEADVLNVALFGKTAKQWRDENPNSKENIRDYANIEQLVVLSNMESINAMLIQQKINQPERLIQLNQLAIIQMKSLIKHKVSIRKLK